MGFDNDGLYKQVTIITTTRRTFWQDISQFNITNHSIISTDDNVVLGGFFKLSHDDEIALEASTLSKKC